jgi:hypothetical protein
LCSVREQRVDDKASGLVLSFAARGDGTTVLTISGVPFPHRAAIYVFNAEGAHTVTGTEFHDDEPWAPDYSRDSS